MKPSDRVREKNSLFRDGFADWLDTPEGGAIYAEFEAQALDIARFRDHWSARTIIEYMRHQSALRDVGQFKVNNCIAPDAARLFMLIHPQHNHFFETREQTERHMKRLGRAA